MLESFPVRSLVVAAAAFVACHELYFSDDDLRNPSNMAKAGDTCATDADCALVPARITCCGECEPVAPFEAMTRTLLEALRRDVEASCAPATRLCDPPSCATLPPGCEVRAVCVAGQCRPEASPPCTYR